MCTFLYCFIKQAFFWTFRVFWGYAWLGWNFSDVHSRYSRTRRHQTALSSTVWHHNPVTSLHEPRCRPQESGALRHFTAQSLQTLFQDTPLDNIFNFLKNLTMYLKIHVLYHFLNHIFTTERSEVSMTFDVPHVSVFQPSLFSLFINDLASITGENIYVDCDMLADNTTLHTCGKHILQIRSNMQLDQISNWRDNNHMAINPIKTKSMTIATRQKHQLSPLPLDLVLKCQNTVS